MTLLRAVDVRLTFDDRVVFDRLEFVIEEGERVGLVGANGTGKSSLMKVLAGTLVPETGTRQVRRGAKITYLTQEPQFPEGATIRSELAVAQHALAAAIADHGRVTKLLTTETDEGKHEKLLGELQTLGDRIERLGGWDTEHQARRLLDRLGVKDWDRAVSELSGGNRKRVALAKALLERPELLLLDEPTNHLDADTVDWLEEELDAMEGALLLVTHDRYFLDDLVDRIVEIQPGGGLVSYPGNYKMYLEQKLVAQAEAERSQHKRERWIAQEVAWLRQGVEARRTKSKARIERAQKLMAERGFQAPKVAALQTVAVPRLGHTVIEAEHVTKAFGERKVLTEASVILQRGERLGLVGPNGAGKTTFLRVLLGELPPDTGTVTIGKNTKVAYYDQQRAQLDPEKTVYESASNEDWVDVGGTRVHLRDYLDDLLFPVPMQRMPVKSLSGGERNRLLLAKLFLQGANVLVLDEPTNDLDIVTLNVLEHLLLGFGGAVLLVTHDRYFLDKVATSILAFENGRITRYPGNYTTYKTLKAQSEERALAEKSAAAKTAQKPAAAAPVPVKAENAPAKKKLSYKDQRELEGMEAAIEAAETKKAELEAVLGDNDTYVKRAAEVVALQAELEKASKEVERLYARWAELGG